MNNNKIISIAILSLMMGQCSSKKEDSPLLKDAAQLHNAAVALATQLEYELDKLDTDSAYLGDSVVVWRTALENWKRNLVEVPGNESDEHNHDHHSHAHGKSVELTPEQMLTIQQEIKAQIEELKKRIYLTTKSNEPF